MGAILAAGLLVIAVPLTAVALRRRPVPARPAFEDAVAQVEIPGYENSYASTAAI
jgi:hypothetical protein